MFTTCDLNLVSNHQHDWLIDSSGYKSFVKESDDKKNIILSNGLISRKWRLYPNCATTSFDNLMTGETMIRTVNPEAIFVINGEEYNIGGLDWKGEQAYLKEEWIDEMTNDPKSFQFIDFKIAPLKKRFDWKQKRYAGNTAWPPKGTSLIFTYHAPDNSDITGIKVDICYEMYDGIPLLSKYVCAYNDSGKEMMLNHFTSEILSLVEVESPVDDQVLWEHPNIHVESDYSFHGMTTSAANETTHWLPDKNYTTQVNVNLNTIVRMESKPKTGPAALIGPNETFETFRTFELIYDSTDRERKALSLKRMYRIAAPWVTENPIFMHVLSDETEKVKLAIDQAAEVGFELVILSFGSGFNMESEDEKYIERMKDLADYAHSKGIEIGGYSLLASRSIGPEDDVINKHGVTFNQSPCLESEWGQNYFERLTSFFEKTGFNALEHDGSYPGDICESTKHPGHRGREDSQWNQWKTIANFYQWCNGKGIYLNVPDWYFLNGSNRTGMGYREVNWALPRDRQIILARQNIFDGTWEKTPSMGWMFVPLMEYHGGGPASTMEPLSEHLDTYDKHLMNNFTSGVQAIYRGMRLYDTEKTKKVVKNWVDLYKEYRDILDSDIIHVKRPDGKNIDCLMHVNPELEIKGFAVMHNPLDKQIEQTIKLPLYYTGLSEKAVIREKSGKEVNYLLDRHYKIDLKVSLAANESTWFLIE